MRCAYYGISVTPTAVFDGTVNGSPPGSWPTIFNLRKNQLSPLDIKVKVTTSANNFNLKATIKRHGPMAASSGLRFHCAVTEQNLSYSGRTFNHVLRKMYPNADGTTFAINENETKQVAVNGTLDGTWKRDNLHFIVWVQSQARKEVYQARLIYWKEVGVEPASLGRIKGLFS